MAVDKRRNLVEAEQRDAELKRFERLLGEYVRMTITQTDEDTRGEYRESASAPPQQPPLSDPKFSRTPLYQLTQPTHYRPAPPTYPDAHNPQAVQTVIT